MGGQHDDWRLEAVLAQDADRLPAVDVRQADIHDDKIDLAGLGGLHALRAALHRNRFEFLMQGELLHQRIAQLWIIIDDQNLAAIRHRLRPWNPALREVEHSGVKEQAAVGIRALPLRPRRKGLPCGGWFSRSFACAAGPATARAASSLPVASRSPSCWAGPAFRRTNERAMARPRGAAFICDGFGGAAIGAFAQPRYCRSAASIGRLPGVKIPRTGATTGRSGARPMNPVTGFGARTISMTASSKLTTIPGPASRAGAAQYSCIWSARTTRRPPAALRWVRVPCKSCSAGLDRKHES